MLIHIVHRKGPYLLNCGKCERYRNSWRLQRTGKNDKRKCKADVWLAFLRAHGNEKVFLQFVKITLLCIPASTAGVERCINLIKLIKTKCRSRMTARIWNISYSWNHMWNLIKLITGLLPPSIPAKHSFDNITHFKCLIHRKYFFKIISLSLCHSISYSFFLILQVSLIFISLLNCIYKSKTWICLKNCKNGVI